METIDWEMTHRSYKTIHQKVFFLSAVLNGVDETGDLDGYERPFGTISMLLDEMTGDFNILEEAITHQAKAEESNRLPRLERFMESLADQIEEEPENWNLKAAAENIRSQLAR